MNVQDKSNTFDLNKYGVGQPVRRTEDPVLVQGQGRYTDDLNLPKATRNRPRGEVDILG